MNLPGTPGHSSIGRKAPIMVAVGAHHRPEHAPRRFGEGLFGRMAFGHFPVGIFDHDDRAVDENADRQAASRT